MPELSARAEHFIIPAMPANSTRTQSMWRRHGGEPASGDILQPNCGSTRGRRSTPSDSRLMAVPGFIACGSLLAERIQGRTLTEAAQFQHDELVEMLEARRPNCTAPCWPKPRSRRRCVLSRRELQSRSPPNSSVPHLFIEESAMLITLTEKPPPALTVIWPSRRMLKAYGWAFATPAVLAICIPSDWRTRSTPTTRFSNRRGVKVGSAPRICPI